MKTTRLEFLKACAAAAVFMPMSPVAVCASAMPSRKRKNLSETVSAADFAPHAGTGFRVAMENAPPLDLTMESVEEGPDQGGMLEQFIVIFRGTKKRRLPEGQYKIKHPALGTLDLFLIPTGSKDTRTYAYQVCICRLTNHIGGQDHV